MPPWERSIRSSNSGEIISSEAPPAHFNQLSTALPHAGVCRLTTSRQQPTTSAHEIKMPMAWAAELGRLGSVALGQHSAGVKRHEPQQKRRTLRALWITLKKLGENIQKKLRLQNCLGTLTSAEA